MKKLLMARAISQAIGRAMAEDEKVFLMGLDIEGGSMGQTMGLVEQFGKKRVVNCPAAESGYTGIALGAALTGLRPVIEIQFSDFVTDCMDQIVNNAAKFRYCFGGNVKVPMTIRLPGGSGGQAGCQHSQNLEAWFTHVPGLKVVLPSTPREARGLLYSSILDDNPVMFFEHKFNYGMTEEIPDNEVDNFDPIPLGVADIKRKGKDLTIVATSVMVGKSLAAAEELSKEGIDVEIIDPRTLFPLDKKTIFESVAKTGRLLVATEENKRGAWSGEVAALVAEEMFGSLKTKIGRLGALDVPYPFAPEMEEYVIPQVVDIVKLVKEMCK